MKKIFKIFILTVLSSAAFGLLNLSFHYSVGVFFDIDVLNSKPNSLLEVMAFAPLTYLSFYVVKTIFSFIMDDDDDD